jgi:hypothetical protein
LLLLRLPSGVLVNPAECAPVNSPVLSFRKAETPGRNVDVFDRRVDNRRKARIDDLRLIHVGTRLVL